MEFRLARSTDFPALADMRWRLKTNDALFEPNEDYQCYLAAFVAWAEGADDYLHWVAEDQDLLRGAMSVATVAKVPAPGEMAGRWGYLTNSYVFPEARNSGVGAELLRRVKDWARTTGLELVIVWPSERAYPFYERAGFQTKRDPLMLEF